MKEETETPRVPPKDRIVATARELFRKHGIRGVGVDTIAEAAGTNKMTLYRHFGSKDELIVACLRQFAATADTVWDDLARAHPGNALAQIHEWVRLCADYVACNGRGCDMANVAVELAEHDHPARRVIEEFERAQRDRLAALCRAAGIADADLLADSLALAERELILRALRAHPSRERAAEQLGISARTLRYKLARLRAAGFDLASELELSGDAA